MNYKGVKSKILRFRRIFTEHCSTFVDSHHRYYTDYYQTEISKMLTCGSEAGGFAIFQCRRCGEEEHKVHFSCKRKASPQCGKCYARDSMTKIAARLYSGVGYRQVVLALPEQLRRPFYNHRDQNRLYLRFMELAQACLEELIHGLSTRGPAVKTQEIYPQTSLRTQNISLRNPRKTQRYAADQ